LSPFEKQNLKLWLPFGLLKAKSFKSGFFKRFADNKIIWPFLAFLNVEENNVF